MPRVALITGISGQDGTYLSELLCEKGYEVHGIASCGAAPDADPQPRIHYADLADGSNFSRLLDEIQPDEVYNLASQSHVSISFELPVHTVNVTGLGVLRLLEAIRLHQERSGRRVRFFQASSSDMYGAVRHSPQNEKTPFHPQSPYACAKLYAYWQTINYREAYGLFASNGILFNHESPRRSESFLTRKVTRAATRIKLGLQQRLSLGNREARRDWGFAGDYVEAMWLTLTQDEPDDFVFATGESHTVQEFVAEVFSYLELDWRQHVDFDAAQSRPLDVALLCGDAGKAQQKLGWKPKCDFRQLVRMMTDHDLELAREELRSGRQDDRTAVPLPNEVNAK